MCPFQQRLPGEGRGFRSVLGQQHTRSGPRPAQSLPFRAVHSHGDVQVRYFSLSHNHPNIAEITMMSFYDVVDALMSL